MAYSSDASTRSLTLNGVVRHDSIYITRAADEELFRLCLRGEFSFMLESRQVGKSSLIDRTCQRLLTEQVLAIPLDLNALGADPDEGRWFASFLAEVCRRGFLDDTHLEEWLSQRSHLSPVTRFVRWFEEWLLTKVNLPVVIFVDEVDCMSRLPFKDDFFAAIRSMHGDRQSRADLRRLSFVFVGTTTLTRLIGDVTRTPYNIGAEIYLHDFQEDEAMGLTTALPVSGLEDRRRILQRVLHWTGGHPYLTVNTIQALANQPEACNSEQGIDRVVAALFFNENRTDDKNLSFVREMLTSGKPIERGRALALYREILRGRGTPDQSRDPAGDWLKLAGVVRIEGQRLFVRNRIYARVFDGRWVKEFLSWKIVVREFARKYVVVAMAALVTLALLMGLLALSYHRQRDHEVARNSELQNRLLAQQRKDQQELDKKELEKNASGKAPAENPQETQAAPPADQPEASQQEPFWYRVVLARETTDIIIFNPWFGWVSLPFAFLLTRRVSKLWKRSPKWRLENGLAVVSSMLSGAWLGMSLVLVLGSVVLPVMRPSYSSGLKAFAFRRSHGFTTVDGFVQLEAHSAGQGKQPYAVSRRFARSIYDRLSEANRLTPYEFERAQKLGSGSPIGVIRNGKANCIDARGKFYFEWKYDFIFDCWADNQPVIVRTGSKYGQVLMDGTYLRDLDFDKIEESDLEWRTGLSSDTLIEARRGQKWGFVDRKTGEIAITVQYDEVGRMQFNRAVVRLGGLCGVIDSKGNSIVYPQFLNAILVNERLLQPSEGLWALALSPSTNTYAWGLYDMMERRWIIQPSLNWPALSSIPQLSIAPSQGGSLTKVQSVWTFNDTPILPTDQWESVGQWYLQRKVGKK